MVLEAIGLFALWQVITVSNPIYYLYPILVVYGVGIGLDIGQLTQTVLSSVPWQKAGMGSGINNTVRQVGSAFGVAIIGAVLVAVMASVGTADLNASTVIPESIKAHLQTVLNNGLSGGLSSTSFPSGSGAMAQAITSIFDSAITQGTKWAAFTAGAFVSLGAIFSLFLPNVKAQWGGQSGEDADSWGGGNPAQQWQQQSGLPPEAKIGESKEVPQSQSGDATKTKKPHYQGDDGFPLD
jgi:hypothetical protein